MPELTVDQKIQLMTLASKMSTPLGCSSADIKTVLSNYDQLVKSVTDQQNQVLTKLDAKGLSLKKK